MKKVDLLILGGGAAGLAAAVEAKRHNAGLQILVLEKAEKVGRKILATGNGRCNLSNQSITPADYNPGAAAFLAMVQPYADDVAFFASMGLLTRADDAGRLYPASNAAASVLDALRFTVEGLGIAVQTDAAVQQILPQKGGYTCLCAGGQSYFAPAVLVATGTQAGTKQGDAKAGLLPAGLPAHRATPLRPALAPVPVQGVPVAIKGLRAKAAVTLLRNGKEVQTAKGEVSFGKDALSGICVMDVSGNVQGTGNEALRLDLAPELTPAQLLAYLQGLRQNRKTFPVEDFLTGLLPKRIAAALLKTVDLTPQNGNYTDAQLAAIAAAIKGWQFAVSAAPGWAGAQVAVGGIEAADCKPGLESALCPGLFFAGELLNVTGRCGGFNLHWAWASGRCAGVAAADYAAAKR